VLFHRNIAGKTLVRAGRSLREEQKAELRVFFSKKKKEKKRKRKKSGKPVETSPPRCAVLTGVLRALLSSIPTRSKSDFVEVRDFWVYFFCLLFFLFSLVFFFLCCSSNVFLVAFF
jgi:hypothetical protein